MGIRRAIIRIIFSSMLLGAMGGALPVLGVAGPTASDPSQTRANCEDWQQRHEGADSAENPCGSQLTFRAEEDLGDLRREEEEKGLRWQPLEPSGPDLSLWYYPGAPRPL
jgi:hypothetical protein